MPVKLTRASMARIIARSPHPHEHLGYDPVDGKSYYLEPGKPPVGILEMPSINYFEAALQANGASWRDYSLNSLTSELRKAALLNPINPRAIALGQLAWDGQHRVQWYATEHLGAADTAAARQWSVDFFHALMQRSMHPGCKMDAVFVTWGEWFLRAFYDVLEPLRSVTFNAYACGMARFGAYAARHVFPGSVVVQVEEDSLATCPSAAVRRKFLMADSDKLGKRVQPRNFVFFVNTLHRASLKGLDKAPYARTLQVGLTPCTGGDMDSYTAKQLLAEAYAGWKLAQG